nr:immunoglobulin light chain junction region [Macaca mulatta]
CHQHNTYPYTF